MVSGASDGPTSQLSPPLRYAMGGLCVLVNVVCSISFLFLVQGLGDSHWNKPWFEVTVYHGVWILLLPMGLAAHALAERGKEQPRRLPWKALLVWGFVGGPVLVAGAFLNYLSLPRMPVAINNALNNGIFLFVYAASIVVLRERITVPRVVGSLVVIGGLVAVTVGSPPSPDEVSTVLGYVFVGCSLCASTVFFLLWASYIKPHSVASYGLSPIVSVFGLGFIGLSTCALMWVGIVIGNATGLEPFELPTGSALTQVLVSMVLDLGINGSNLVGIVFVSASFMAVGGLLSIPLSFAAQALFFPSAANITGPQIAGVVLIAAGVLVFELAEPAQAACQLAHRKRNPHRYPPLVGEAEVN